ncbi:FAD-binding protein [Endozoicomonas lisbonensis]|uniref:Thioredoxin reductase n=1 Tax=Endozoicomonas lisbonensis TaxID=3120522 RepID=A0ABV2SKQ0_9GAMM
MENNNNIVPDKTWDKTVDVVVVGSGTGALTAALRSHDLGMKVLVVVSGYPTIIRYLNSVVKIPEKNPSAISRILLAMIRAMVV